VGKENLDVGDKELVSVKREGRENGRTPTPPFFVSVASKGLRVYVSGLESTLLARGHISVAAKGLMWAKCWRENNGLGGKILKELEGSSMNL
jgi:hypothetical protein